MKKISLPVLLTGGFILAFLIRLMLIPNPGFEADVSFWKSWGLAVLDFGIVKGLPLTNFNYPTPFGYFLALMVGAYKLFADPHNFNEFWLNSNLLFLFISKLPAIIADFAIAGIFLWIGRNPKRFGFPSLPSTIYYLSSIIYLLNPISLIDGAWWGQIDSVGVFAFLLALLALLKRKPFLSGFLFMLAMLTKLQNMIYGPIFFLLVWQLEGWSGLMQSLAATTLTFFGLNIEFVLTHNMARVIESLTGNYDYFPWLSLNAFNPWWIWSGAAGMKGSDKTLVLGLLSAKNLGLYLFSAGYLFAVLFMKPMKSFLPLSRNLVKNDGVPDHVRDDIIYRFLTALMVVNGSFFLFQTESHDRYAFPFIVNLLLWLPFFLKRHLPTQAGLTVKERLNVFASKQVKVFSIFYILFTILYFYNLHYALIVNYPQNGLPIPALPALTLCIAYIFTGAFLWFLLFLQRDADMWTYILPIGLIGLALFAKNIPLILKQPVYVEKLTPTEYKQDYGGREIDMPVNASLGLTNWSNLSVQYAFYRRGIGTHANSYQIFDIGGLFSKFTFDYGVDTEAGSKGSVTFEVWGLPAEASAKEGDWKKLFSSQKIGRYDLPRHAEVTVTGVRTLKLVVTDAGDGITDDHADWLNPRLFR